MRLAVFSDSHGPIEEIRNSLKKLSPVDYVLFAGDGIDKLVSSSLGREFKIIAVKGNRDKGAMYPREKTLIVGEKKILVVHGHNHGIKWGLGKLYYKAKEVGAEIVVFGHTHRRLAEEKEGILFFNPGSITAPRDKLPPSYGLLEIEDGEVDYYHYNAE